jgi:hypothetical protein
MPEQQEKKKGWFSRIESREEALEAIKEVSVGVFVIAGLQSALSFFFGLSTLFDAVIYAAGGFFLRRFNSRIAAVVLLLLALAGAVVTIANRLGANLASGKNVFLALILLVLSARAVEATFKLRGRISDEVASQ